MANAVTREQAAALNASTRTIDRLRKQGEIDEINIGQVMARICAASLDEYTSRRRNVLDNDPGRAEHEAGL
jgi:hypothetical protein